MSAASSSWIAPETVVGFGLSYSAEGSTGASQRAKQSSMGVGLTNGWNTDTLLASPSDCFRAACRSLPDIFDDNRPSLTVRAELRCV